MSAREVRPYQCVERLGGRAGGGGDVELEVGDWKRETDYERKRRGRGGR